MVIEVKESVFVNEKNLRDVNHLINIFSHFNRYEFFCDYSQIKESEVYKKLLDIDKAIIQEYFKKHVTQSSKFNYTVQEPSSDLSFDLNEAIMFFSQPIKIILENNLNDGWFIKSILKNFEKEGKTIAEYYKRKWIEDGNGNGCTGIINFLRRELASYRAFPKKNKEKYLRCFVLVDSDNRFPNMPYSNGRDKLVNFLKELNIPYHILEKREMENYLPDEVFQLLSKDDPYVQEYLKMSPLQKDYFDIESGLDKNNFNDKHRHYSKEISILYKNLSRQQIDVLSKRINFENFKTEFPKLFMTKEVTENTLMFRIVHQQDSDEFRTILKKITQLL